MNVSPIVSKVISSPLGRLKSSKLQFSLDSILKVADGCVVGTSLKYDGVTWNQVDGKRVKEFMNKVNEIRGS